MSRDRAQWLDVAGLVARAAPVDFELKLEAMPRIAPLLARAEGVARGQFRFHRFAAEESTAAFDAAEGDVSAKLVLTCQRCLGDLELAIRERFALAFVSDEPGAAAIPASHDPVIMTQGKVHLGEMVEEQLLLGLPLVATHVDAGECERRLGEAGRAGAVADQAEGRPRPTHHPFAGLRDLMKK